MTTATRVLRAGLTVPALAFGLLASAPPAAAQQDLEGRAFAGPDGALYVVQAGVRYPLQLATTNDAQLAGVPRVESPPVVSLNRDPRVTRAASFWGVGDPLHADAALQGRLLQLDGVPYVYQDGVQYRIDLANVSGEAIPAMPLAEAVERLDQAFASTAAAPNTATPRTAAEHSATTELTTAPSPQIHRWWW